MATVQTMEKDHRNQEKLDKTRAILRQFPHGIGVVELARKLHVGRSTVYGIMQSLDRQGKGYLESGICYPKDFSGKERYAEGSPELELLREQFKREYGTHFDQIEGKYFSSSKKAWEELKKFAAKLPEPVMSQFLRLLTNFDSKNGPEPYWFERILFVIRENVWRTLLMQKMAELSQVREN